MIQDLTIHEAMPGHYLQLAHSTSSKLLTLICAIFTSGPFVEGMGKLMLSSSWLSGAAAGPQVKMQQLKMRLRLIINAILDQRSRRPGHVGAGSHGILMMNEGFQEEGEAAGKWRRACLSSTQLSTYYVGNVEINYIRQAYEENTGPLATSRPSTTSSFRSVHPHPSM